MTDNYDFFLNKGGKDKTLQRKMLVNTEGTGSFRTAIMNLPDGKHMVRTKDGMPQYTVEKDKALDDDETPSIYLDSGVVDLISVAPDNPDSLKDAPLYRGSIQQAFYALKKLLAKIFPPKIKATSMPANGTAGKSFKASLDELLRAGTPNEMVGLLYTKKFCAASCPASMFTGKARLFMQAHYGAPLNRWKWSLDIPLGLSPRLVHDTTGAVVNTSSGIYTDSEYRHWLVTIHPGGILVTKMSRTKEASALVPLLKNADYAADWKKIEAYILAYTYPVDFSFNIDVHGIPAPQMLGYGWKFNWSGSKADIIEHVEGSPNHTSTHYRITLNRDEAAYVPTGLSDIESEKQRWAAVLSVVQGPVTWHNTRYSSVIAHPDWLTSCLWVFGTLSGGHDGSNVPVYCFYNSSDVLEVFRYNCSGGNSALRYSIVSEPADWMRPFDWSTENVGDYTHFGSTGLDGATGERRIRSYNPVVAGFTSSEVNAVISSQQYTFNRYTMSSKTYDGQGSVWTTDNTGFNAFAQDCYAVDSGPSPYSTLSDGVVRYGSGTIAACTPGASLGYASGFWTTMANLSYDRYNYNGSHVETAKTLLLVPFYDAEAAYIRASNDIEETATGTGGTVHSTNLQPGFFVYEKTYYFSLPGGGFSYYSFLVYGGGDGTHLGNNGDPAPDLHTVSESIAASKLVTKAGSFDFSPLASLSPFYSGIPLVEQQYHTHSAGVGSAAYGHGAVNLEGFPNTFSSPPPFIGWA